MMFFMSFILVDPSAIPNGGKAARCGSFGHYSPYSLFLLPLTHAGLTTTFDPSNSVSTPLHIPPPTLVSV
jgi:hypothetical protein